MERMSSLQCSGDCSAAAEPLPSPQVVQTLAHSTSNAALMNQDLAKRLAAQAAIAHVQANSVLGVGTGSTVNHFIDLLAEHRVPLHATVSSSSASTARLRAHGYPVVELNDVGSLALYVDGADEVNAALQMIKGGGGALTREKIIAAASAQFICIADASKRVETLGRFPLPIEVIDMAIRLVSERMQALGGRPLLREGFVSDNGHPIIDVHGLHIDDPAALEAQINAIPGVVTVGLFAQRGADRLIIGGSDGVHQYLPQRG